MKISIRKKLVLAISGLVVLLFALMAFLFINEKKEEMAQDIYLNALAFGRLTANKVAADTDLYLATNSFVYFNREVAGVFAQNDDVERIAVVSYDGELIYDSAVDVEARYDGDARLVEADLAQALRSENVGLKYVDGKMVYVKEGKFVDENERAVASFEADLLDYLVVPASEDYSVVYYLDYHNLDQRVAAMVMRIVYLALFGVMLGFAMAMAMSGQLTRPILKLVEGARQIAMGNFRAQVDVQTRDEIKDLGDSFNHMALKLGESMQAQVYQARVTHELSLAKKIQTQILPKAVPKVSGLDIAAGIIPAEEIGGDIYDFLWPTEGKLRMYLGDVTGHGVPAGIVSSLANALFYGFRDESSLKELLVKVNAVLKAKTLPMMFMTAAVLDYELGSGKCSYVSAGHEQIVHYKAALGRAELLPAGGLALGMMVEVGQHIVEREIDLAAGDFLVVYSDGIPEMWKSKDEVYGMARFIEAVGKFGVLDSALAIQEAILADVKQFSAGYPQMDDVTLLVIKKQGNTL